MGNRTSLSDIFGGNIGAPQPIGTTQQPNQLFTLLQSLLGGQNGQPGMMPPQQVGGGPQITQQPPQMGGGRPPGFGGGPDISLPPQPGGTALSAITAQTPQMGGATGTSLSNPFGSLINQRFVR